MTLRTSSGTPVAAAFRSAPTPYHTHVASTVVVVVALPWTRALPGSWTERRARARPDKQEPLAAANSTTSDGIFQNGAGAPLRERGLAAGATSLRNSHKYAKPRNSAAFRAAPLAVCCLWIMESY